MADVHDKATRSYNMSRIKGKDTKPEMLVRKYLHAHGFRYRLHVKDLPGKPDIVLPKYGTIIDIRGCFWHDHRDCKYGDGVKTASVVVSQKRSAAAIRDDKNFLLWNKMGWRVIVIWSDCQLEPKKKKSTIRESTLQNILQELLNANTDH